jgi:DNA-binding response OmpR family regulator
MRTQRSLKPARADCCTGAQIPFLGGYDFRPADPEKGAILLVSDDVRWGQDLQDAARQGGREVVRVGRVIDALQTLRAIRPTSVLLDLDLSAEAAWKAADLLLEEESCPQLILLTAHSEQFDTRMAIRAGSVVDKATEPAQLLRLMDLALKVPPSTQGERNAIQRVMIRWLRPCGWSVPLTPGHHFWRLNE